MRVGKKRRFSADVGKDVDHPHDDNAGTHTAWHDLHLPTFHRMTQKHTDRLRERLSTVGTLIEVPEGISTCRLCLRRRRRDVLKTAVFKVVM